MTYNATVYKVMISAPSDVKEELGRILTTLAMWNALHSERVKKVLLPVDWKSNLPPKAGQAAQKQINSDLLEHSDVLVAVFWNRIGTPTQDAESGTVEEIKKHVERGKPTLVYFSETKCAPNLIDLEQRRGVIEFKDWYKSNNGIFKEYFSGEEFSECLVNDLTALVYTDPYFQSHNSPAALESGGDHSESISPLAMSILQYAVKGNARVTHFKHMGGVHFSAGDLKVVPRDDRERASWVYAIKQLASKGLISDETGNGEIYGVTSEGYSAADGM